MGFIKESMSPGLVCGSHPKGSDGCNSSCSTQSLRIHLVQGQKAQQIQFQGSLDHIRNAMTMWCKASVWCKFTLMVPFYVKDINSFTSEYFALIIHTINDTCTVPEHRHCVSLLRPSTCFDRSASACSVLSDEFCTVLWQWNGEIITEWLSEKL